MSSVPETGDWHVGGFEGVERAQHLWSSRWTLAEKVEWLEGAQELAEFMQAQYHARRERERAAAGAASPPPDIAGRETTSPPAA